MLKKVVRKNIAFLLVLFILLGNLPTVYFENGGFKLGFLNGLLSVNAQAANINTDVVGLSAVSSGEATWTPSGGKITGSAKTTSKDGCGGTTYSNQNGTLTFTNESDAVAVLSFDYSLELNGGSATVDSVAVTTGASFSKTLSDRETVVVSITSNFNAEGTTSIVISNLKLTPEVNVDITFKAPSHGSYTVDDFAVTANTVKTVKTTDSIALAATPASGYKFFGWKNETTGSYFSTNASCTANFTENSTVYPVFVSNSTPMFQVGARLFTNLNEAIGYATSSGTAKIVLVSDGTLPAGNYTIPAGKTLLIPFDDAQTVYTTVPEVVFAGHVNPSAFRTLTMVSGAKITVANGGAISVPSKLCANGQNGNSWNGTPTGKHGRITMNAGSSIDVQSDGKLYVYGYISGSGNVYARSGSEVWECFQIRCWRGGTATSGMAGNDEKVFPLNQYYVQNIEAPLTLYPGATEKIYTAVNMSSRAFTASATFVGSGGMFFVDNGSITKRFTGTSDRLELNVDGEFRITPMSLRITGLPLIGTIDLNTADYVLPIQSNITINVNSGTTTVSQDVAFLPGSEVSIANGATLTIESGKKAYVYDKDQWGAYAASGLQLVPVGYSTVNGATAKRTTASLVDAKIDVNGTLNAAGSLYTTEGGAAIISSGGTGKVILTAAPGNETKTYQATQSGSDMTYVDIPITAAKLQNGNEPYTYTETAGSAAGTTYYYCKQCDPQGIWETEHSQTHVHNLTEHPAKTATCTEQGNSAYWSCECGKYFSDANGGTEITEGSWIIAALGHDLTHHEAKAATCTEIGWNAYDTCSRCDYTTYVEISALGHDLIHHEAKAATCTEIGWNAYDTCSRCDYTTYVEIPAHGHDLIHHEAKAATCTEIGWNAYDTCSRCDYTTYEEISALGHDLIHHEAKAATCTEIGWNAYDTCSRCNYTTYVEIPAMGHEYSVVAWHWNEDYSAASVDLKCNHDASHTATKEAVVSNAQGSGEQTGYTVYTATVEFNNQTFTDDKTKINTYTVTWKNEDGTVLETDENVPYGTTPTYDGETPTKAQTDEFTYAFAGWTPEVVAVTGNAEYTATYTTTKRSYTITWKNDDGSVIDTTTVEYGTVPTHADPTKAATAQYTYTFTGWDHEITAVTGDATYTATYSSTVNEYTIKFVNEDGTELQSGKVAYGETPVYNGETPTKAGDAQYSYTFDKWSPDITAVTGDATYTAQFESTVNEYTITFVNEDGTELQSGKVAYGTTPSYTGAIPTKAATAQYSYTFAGWDKEIVAVTGDTTYTATFTETVNKYTIKFVNEDGTELQSSEVAYGETPVYTGATPTKTGDAQYSYTFNKWSPDITTVEGDVTYTATFTQTVNEYTITWVDGDGNTLKTEQIAYGEIPSYTGETPTKTATAQYTYTFNNTWSPEITAVTGDATYTAQFNSTVNKYNISFFNGDDCILTKQFEYGVIPVYSGSTPTRGDTESHTYTFIGWSSEPDGEVLQTLPSVTGSAQYYAVYEETIKTFVITWMIDGVSTTETYEYGATPSYKGETPTKASTDEFEYEFVGWTPRIIPVTTARTYVAQFKETRRSYTITWLDDDGTLIDQTMVEYGKRPTHEEPVKEATAEFTYTFAGWTPDIVNVTGVATYTATYSATVNEYAIRFVNYNGDVLQSGFIAYGELPEYTGDTPVKPGDVQHNYTFAGWDPEITTVTGPATYTAQFTEATNTYTIKFINYNGRVLQNSEVAYGETPVFAGETPVKTADDQCCSYKFAGWSKTQNGTVLATLPTVTGNASYYAVFTTIDHDYELTGWTWAENYSTATATFTCKNDNTHVETVNAAITSVTTAATCEADGKKVYTATVTFNGQTYTDQKTVTIPAKGHDYELTGWTWAENYSTATATFTCKKDSTHVETVNATITSETTDATCEAAGKTVYTATVEFEGETYTDTKEETIPATGHDYELTGWTWTGYTAATATFTCNNDSTHVETVNATITRETTAATCETAGKTVYTATVTFEGETYTDTKEETIPATGHDYELTGWTWTGYTAATATFTCKNDPEHVETVEATVTSSEGTGENIGHTVYTATAEYDGKTYIDEKIIINKYTVTFVNYDGTVLQTGEVEYGKTPEYNGETPHKAPDETNVYVFAGWDPEITAVTGDATYTAVFEAEVIEWTGPVWSWADFVENGFDATAKATATFTSGEMTTTKTVSAVTGELVKIDGKDTTYAYKYTATVEFNGQTYTNEYSHEFEAVTLIGYAPTLAGVLSLNFKFQAPENAATVKLVYEFDGSVVEIGLSKDGPYFVIDGTSKFYKVPFTNIQSACITKNVTMKVYDADGNEIPIIRLDKNFYGTEFSCCMADWAKTMLDDPARPEKTKQLAHALLNYGYYASKYFGLKNNNPEKYSFNYEKYGEYLDLSMVENVTADKANDAEGADEAKENTSYKGALITLEGSTTLRLYFDSTKAMPAVKNAAGKAYTVYQNDIGYYVEVSGIASGHLNVKYTFVITDEDGVDYTVKYSVLSWANAMITRGKGENNEYENAFNLAKALYQYCTAARVYFGIN